MVRIKDVPLMQRDVCVGKLLALTPPRRLKKLGVAAEETPHPMGDEPVSLISEADRRVVKAAGVQVWTPAGVVALHLGSLLRDEATQFIGVYEVGQTIKKMEKAYPDLVKEVVPKVVSLAQLVEVLRRVVDEGVSIRDFKTILETLSEHGPYESDTLALSELVRAGLSRQIAHHHAGLSNRLPVLLLDAAIEDVIEGGITRTTRGSVLALDPEITRSIVRCVAKALEPMVQRGTPPVIVTSSRVRRLVRKIIELDLPGVPVLSFEELPPRLVVQPMGRASLAMLDG